MEKIARELEREHVSFLTISEPGTEGGGRGGLLPCNRLMGICRWMGSHFHDWIDYNGVAFSIKLLEWGRIFSDLGGKNILASREFWQERIRLLVLGIKYTERFAVQK